MIRIDDPALVRCLAEDFLETFRGRNQTLDRSFDEGRLILLDGLNGNALLKEVLDQIASAREEVFVESAYVSGPFLDALETAARRGIRVVIVVPEVNNWKWHDAYTRIECCRRGLELHHYRGSMNHVKAVLIDSRVLMLGSCNFDYFAYYLHQDLLFITTDRNPRAAVQGARPRCRIWRGRAACPWRTISPGELAGRPSASAPPIPR